MAPLLLLLLAAGGVALIAKSSSSGAVVTRADRIADTSSTLDGAVVTAKDEKFMDPMYLVFGKTDAAGRRTYAIAPWNQRPHNGIGQGIRFLLNRWGSFGWEEGLDDSPTLSVGYEYLEGVSYTAEARIKQMRAVIAERGKNPEQISPDRAVVLKSILAESKKRMDDIGWHLTDLYASAKGSATTAAKLAGAMGVDTSVITAEAASMLASYSNNAEMVAATLKSYGPMAQTFLNSGLTAFNLLTTDGGSTTEALKWAQIASEVSMYIPLVGPYVSGVASILAGSLAEELRDNLRDCTAGQGEAVAVLNTLSAMEVPMPLHAYQIFHGTCGKDNQPPSSLGYLTTLFTRVAQDWYRLSPETKLSAHKWWGVAATYANHPDVRDVFTNLGFDASGGMIASDEQVMLVAAPIAIAYGLDVDTFAIALWKKSKGWRGAATERNIGVGSASSVRAFCEGDTCRIPTNAWVLQWCQLTGEAMELAASWPRPAAAAVPAAFSAEAVKLGTEAFKAAEGLKLPGGIKFG